MKIKIRDWEKHFERDRTKQWKRLEWVPVPNKQGAGYRKIMKQKNGLEIFAVWIALIQIGSMCTPRGDLSKYSIDELSDLTLISDHEKIHNSILYLSQVLDWIEVVENLDTNVKNLDTHGMPTSFGSSVLFSSVQSCSINSITPERFVLIPEQIKESFSHFCDMRKKIKKPLTEKAMGLIISKLEKLFPGDFEKQNESLLQSVENSWQGVFEISVPNQKRRYGREEPTMDELKKSMSEAYNFIHQNDEVGND